jgi:hypothetical protein
MAAGVRESAFPASAGRSRRRPRTIRSAQRREHVLQLRPGCRPPQAEPDCAHALALRNTHRREDGRELDGPGMARGASGRGQPWYVRQDLGSGAADEVHVERVG